MSQVHDTSINSDTMSDSEESTCPSLNYSADVESISLVGSLLDILELAREVGTNDQCYTYDDSSSEDHISKEAYAILSSVEFDPYPIFANCPTCQHITVTRVQYQAGNLTWLISGILLLHGCCLGCFLIPFCLSICKDVIHVCPDCHTVLGVYKRKI